jgi:hypothetical protein
MDGRTDAGSADQQTADGADGAARGCRASTLKAPGPGNEAGATFPLVMAYSFKIRSTVEQPVRLSRETETEDLLRSLNNANE